MTHLDALMRIDDLAPEQPLFRVQAPDGRRDWAETPRQTSFLRDMKMLAPTVLCFAIPNAGKRNPGQARKEGITSGVFDVCCVWDGGEAWPEFKGYTSAGRAGTLSDNQIRWGNRMHSMGKHVACFFDPVAAIEWLRELGAPIKGRGGL